MPPRRPLRPAALVATAALVLLVAAVSGCGSSTPASAPVPTTTTLAAPTTTTTPATVASTTTTTALPPALQPSAADAAQVFIDGWVNGDRAAASGVATARAVATLFAHPYAGQTVISRGCSTEFPPLVCSYGPYGGGAGTLYEVDVEPAGASWYVSSVDVEG